MYPRYVLLQVILLTIILVWVVSILLTTNIKTVIPPQYTPRCYDPPITDNPISSLAAVSAIPPPVPINCSCHLPPLPPHPDCDHDPGLTGEHLHQPRKLVLMTLFSFEADTLEIMLTLVDIVFMCEEG